MKKVKGQPITGATPEYSKKRPFVPNAKDTSADEQTFIRQAPMPFKDNDSTAQIPAPQAPRGAVPGLEPKPYAGLSGNKAPMNPSGAAIGQAKMPNQSKQIGGRNGWPPPKRKAGVNGQGFPSHRNASFYGE